MKYVLNGTNAFIIYVENCSLRIYVYIKKTGSKDIKPYNNRPHAAVPGVRSQGRGMSVCFNSF